MREYKIMVKNKPGVMFSRGFFGEDGREKAQKLIDSGHCAYYWPYNGDTFEVVRVPFRLRIPRIDWFLVSIIWIAFVGVVAFWWAMSHVPPEDQGDIVLSLLVGFVISVIMSR